MVEIPEGYSHIGTSEGIQFGSSKAVMYRSKVHNLFLLVVDEDEESMLLTRSQLEAVVHVSTDVLERTK